MEVPLNSKKGWKNIKACSIEYIDFTDLGFFILKVFAKL